MTSLAHITSNEQVKALENQMRDLPQTDLGTTHLIHAGMYARTIFIPKDTVLTGALTNCDNICIIHGDITVTTSSGNKRFTGFNVIPADSGFKRAGVSHEDTYWTTVFQTDSTVLEDIEKEVTDEHAGLQSNSPLLKNNRGTLCL